MIKKAPTSKEKDELENERDEKLEILRRDLEIKKAIKVEEMKRKHKEIEKVQKKKVREQSLTRIKTNLSKKSSAIHTPSHQFNFGNQRQIIGHV